jgi:predicted Zn-dependent peptidase
LPAALDLLKELIFYPTFPNGEITKIKENMKAAIRERADSIFASASLVLKKELFPNHPYGMEEEGTMETVEAIQRSDLVEFYERFAVPGNMVLSIFGDIDAGKVLEDLKMNLGEIEGRPVTLESHALDPLIGPREQKLFMDKEQALVLFGFHGAALGDEDVYGLEAATAILGSPFSGRLFNNIRDQLGNAYTLGGHYVPGLGAGLIYFYVMTTDEEVDKVIDLLKREIRSLQTEFVPEQEFNDIKTYLKGTFRASRETNRALAFMASLDELYGLGFENYLQYDAKIDQVTREDVRDIAMRYFDLEKVAVVVTRPKRKSDL